MTFQLSVIPSQYLQFPLSLIELISHFLVLPTKKVPIFTQMSLLTYTASVIVSISLLNQSEDDGEGVCKTLKQVTLHKNNIKVWLVLISLLAQKSTFE